MPGTGVKRNFTPQRLQRDPPRCRETNFTATSARRRLTCRPPRATHINPRHASHAPRAAVPPPPLRRAPPRTLPHADPAPIPASHSQAPPLPHRRPSLTGLLHSCAHALDSRPMRTHSPQPYPIARPSTPETSPFSPARPAGPPPAAPGLDTLVPATDQPSLRPSGGNP